MTTAQEMADEFKRSLDHLQHVGLLLHEGLLEPEFTAGPKLRNARRMAREFLAWTKQQEERDSKPASKTASKCVWRRTLAKRETHWHYPYVQYVVTYQDLTFGVEIIFQSDHGLYRTSVNDNNLWPDTTSRAAAKKAAETYIKAFVAMNTN